jgi:hypothetical protein
MFHYKILVTKRKYNVSSKYLCPGKFINKYLTQWAHHIVLTPIQQVNRHPVDMESKRSSIFSLEDSLLLAQDTMYCGRDIPAIQRSLLPPS